MQGVEHRIGSGGFELRHQVFAGIDLDGVEAFFLQRLHHTTAGGQRHLALGGAAAHQHGDAVEGGHATPTRLISHSSVTPDFSLTRLRTSSPSASRSDAVASPVLIRKLVCFSETCAPPIFRPRHPASSINCQALWPGGFLNVLPPVLDLMGWLASRLADRSSIRNRMAAGSSLVPSNTASTKISSLAPLALRYSNAISAL